MVIFKTLSIVIVLFFSNAAHAVDFYLGGGASFSGVISSSDYYNGATTIMPSVNPGIKHGAMSVEGLFRSGTLKNQHAGYNIDLKTLQYGLMFRFSLQEWLDLNAGYHITSVEGSSSIYNSTALTGLINETITAPVFGLGFNIPFTENLRIRSDFNYYIGKEIYSLFHFDLSFTYRIISF